MGVTSLIILLIGIFYYWKYSATFDYYLFAIGLFASIFDTAGKSLLAYCLSIGPAGPILGMEALTSVLLTINEAIRVSQIPNWIQGLGLFFGVFGAVVLSQEPETFNNAMSKICSCFK